MTKLTVIPKEIKEEIIQIKKIFNKLKFVSEKNYGNFLVSKGAKEPVARVIVHLRDCIDNSVLEENKVNRDLVKNRKDDMKTPTGRPVRAASVEDAWYIDYPALAVFQFTYTGGGNNPSLKENQNFSVSLIVLENGNAKMHFANGMNMRYCKPFMLARTGDGVFETKEAPLKDVVRALLDVTKSVKAYSETVSSQNEIRAAMFNLLGEEFNPPILKVQKTTELPKKQLAEINDLFNIGPLELMLASWKKKHWKTEESVKKSVDALPVSENLKNAQSVVDELNKKQEDFKKAMAENQKEIDKAQKLVVAAKKEVEKASTEFQNSPLIVKQFSEMEQLLKNAVSERDAHVRKIMSDSKVTGTDGALISLQGNPLLPKFGDVQDRYIRNKANRNVVPVAKKVVKRTKP